ncbi:hypothetical protein [Acidimangrovimonas pyrenivorans]|uniref:Uncharacterized protein n=1 Tax=Acidimangrovimonas pyrenivorans TaxID=2030798 RepID=A0ABV7AG90_9RHOB
MGDSAETKRSYRQELLDAFGISYDVTHASNPEATVVYGRLLSPDQLKIDVDQGEVKISLAAYADHHGNDVCLTIPVAGLRLLLHEYEREELRASFPDEV